MKTNTELLNSIIEATKKDKRLFRKIKIAAVESQNYELACNLRAFEKENWPETEEIKYAKERAGKLNVLFRMVEVNAPEHTCWLIDQAIKRHSEKNGEFSLKDAAELTAEYNRIFDL